MSSVFQLLCKRSSVRQHQLAAVQSGAADVCRHHLLSLPPDAAAMVDVCRLVEAPCGEPEACRVLAGEDTLSRLATVAAAHAVPAAATGAALGALAAVCKGTETLRGPTKPRITDAAMSAVLAYMHETVVVLPFCALARQFCYRMRRSAADGPGLAAFVPVLLRVWRDNTTTARIVEAAADALRRFCENPAVGANVADGGIVALVVDAVRRFSPPQPAIDVALTLLVDLVTDHALRAEVAAEVVNPVLGLLSHVHSAPTAVDASVSTVACVLLHLNSGATCEAGGGTLAHCFELAPRAQLVRSCVTAGILPALMSRLPTTLAAGGLIGHCTCQLAALLNNFAAHRAGCAAFASMRDPCGAALSRV